MVERVAAMMLPGHEQRGARVAGEIPGMARERRHEEERRAVEIAGHADQRRQRTASRRLQRRQRAGAGEPHQPLGVGDGVGMSVVRIGERVGHGGLEASGESRSDKPGAPKGSRAPRRAPLLRSLANASNFMVILHNSRGRPSGSAGGGGSPSLEHIQAINGLTTEPARASCGRNTQKAGASCPPSRWSTTTAIS